MAKSPGTLRALGAVGSVGFAFVIAIVLGWWLGATLDRWFDTGPWLTFVFFGFGVVAGAINVFRAFGSESSSNGGDGT